MTDRKHADEWLVDAFNVLQVAGLCREESSWWKAQSRRLLIQEAEGLSGSGSKLTLVFDGPHPVEADQAFPKPDLEVVFAPSADDWILAALKERVDPDRVTVVTADRRLAGKCRGRGARLETPAAFISRCRGSS